MLLLVQALPWSTAVPIVLQFKAHQLRCLAVTLAGKLVREVSVSSLQPQCVVSAMQLVGHQQHHSRLAIAVSSSEPICWVHISDGAATEAVLAGRFAAMRVEHAGKCSS